VGHCLSSYHSFLILFKIIIIHAFSPFSKVQRKVTSLQSLDPLLLSLVHKAVGK